MNKEGEDIFLSPYSTDAPANLPHMVGCDRQSRSIKEDSKRDAWKNRTCGGMARMGSHGCQATCVRMARYNLDPEEGRDGR